MFDRSGSTMKFGVIGLGLFGKKLARKLAEMDHEVLAVDQDEEAVTAVRDDVDKAVIGDVKQEGLLEELLTEDFDAVISTMATSLEASLLTVLHSKQLGVERIIAKSNGPEHSLILRRLGIDEIISPEEDVAEQLAEQIGNPRVQDYFKLREGHTLIEMVVPESFVGESLRDLELREEYGVQVIGVQKNGRGPFDYVPSPNEPFESDDIISVTGPNEVLEELSNGKS